MSKFKWEFGFDQTFTSQIELLPRITIRYDKYPCIAIDWLWFSMYVNRIGPDPHPRKVVCAALRCPSLGNKLILGPRHHDQLMRDQIWDSGGFLHCRSPDTEQGFIDQRGVFMDRAEAAGVAMDADQLRTTALDRMLKADVYELYSEDLY